MTSLATADGLPEAEADLAAAVAEEEEVVDLEAATTTTATTTKRVTGITMTVMAIQILPILATVMTAKPRMGARIPATVGRNRGAEVRTRAKL